MTLPQVNTAEHTEGPFKIERWERGTVGPAWVVLNDDRIPIAFVPAWDTPAPGEELGADEAKANARLIAAAPDLLSAAMTVLEWMNRLPIPTEGCTAKGQLLHDAISKATGTP